MTVTSNIHIGVPAWATGRTYAVGDRVTNVGNAYRCIAPGVSVGGPGGTASDITDGTVHWRWISAVDFTSLTAWWASIPSTLTQPVVGVLDYFSAILATAGAALLNATGKTTSSTNTITLTVASGDSIRDSISLFPATWPLIYDENSGAAIRLPATTGSVNYINIDVANFTLDGIQCRDPNPTSASTIIRGTANATNLKLRNLILDGYAQSTPIMQFLAAADLSNILVIDRQASGGSFIAVDMQAAGGSVVNCGIDGINNPSSGVGLHQVSATVRNSWFFGHATAVSGSSGSAPTDHSAFGSTLPTACSDGGSNLVSLTAASQFVSRTATADPYGTAFASDYGPTGPDWTPLATSALVNAGATDTTHIPTADDLGRTPRPQGTAWDIGPREIGKVSQFPFFFLRPMGAFIQSRA